MAKDYQVRVRFNDLRFYYGRVATEELRDAKVDFILTRLERESMDHIVGEQGEVLNREFTYKNTKFTIVSTNCDVGDKCWDTVDTVCNTKTMQRKEFTRRKLYELTRKNNG